MMIAPVVHIERINRDQLNRCLVDWGHRMGPFTRPAYAIDAHYALFHNGAAVAVTSASDTVREVVAQTGLRRDQCVELARLCAARPHLCRPMLRLWREFIFPALAERHGRQIAVSYQDEALHSGDVYRFDGWAMIGKGGGTGTDNRTGRKGRKLGVWAWPPSVAREAMEDRP